MVLAVGTVQGTATEKKSFLIHVHRLQEALHHDVSQTKLHELYQSLHTYQWHLHFGSPHSNWDIICTDYRRSFHFDPYNKFSENVLTLHSALTSNLHFTSVIYSLFGILKVFLIDFYVSR